MALLQNLSVQRLWELWLRRCAPSVPQRRRPLLLGAPRLGERSRIAAATRQAKRERVGAAARGARTRRRPSSSRQALLLDAELRARFPYVAALLAELNQLAGEARDAAQSGLRNAAR